MLQSNRDSVQIAQLVKSNGSSVWVSESGFSTIISGEGASGVTESFFSSTERSGATMGRLVTPLAAFLAEDRDMSIFQKLRCKIAA